MILFTRLWLVGLIASITIGLLSVVDAQSCPTFPVYPCSSDGDCTYYEICNFNGLCVSLTGGPCFSSQNCISGDTCINCMCTPPGPFAPTGPPTVPPIAPPVMPPTAPPVVPPIAPPTTPPVAPPVSSAVAINCSASSNLPAVATLIGCQIACGSACTYCGDVYSYCLDEGQLTANFTINTCMVIRLDYTLTSAGICPFADSIDECCDNVGPPIVAPVEPPIVPPVAPPVIPPIAPPTGPVVPTVDCTNNDVVVPILELCQVACGTACSFCGQVYTYCSDQGLITANYTIDYCLVTELNGTPTSLGLCPFNTSIDTCCALPAPPVVPPVPTVDCTNNEVVVPILEDCQIACGSGCSVCGQVYTYCSDQGLITANYTIDYCLITELNGIPTSLGLCPFNTSIDTCCVLPAPPVVPPIPTVDCTNTDVVVPILEACQVACGSGCSVCGQVYTYCSDQGLITANYTIDYCLITELNGTPTSLGLCPFNTSIDICCDIPAPPVVPPVAPPVTPIVPEVDCLNNTAITEVLEACEIACGVGCDYCGQVFTYCTTNGFLTANYTLTSCNVIALDFIPVTAGCPYNATLDACCDEVQPPLTPISPPVVPPVAPPSSVAALECTESSLTSVVSLLEQCQIDCGLGCTICAEVYVYCEENDFFAPANFTVETCNILTLDSILTSAGACPFQTTLFDCCDIPEPPIACNATEGVDWIGNIPYNVSEWSTDRFEPALFVNRFNVCLSDVIIDITLTSADYQTDPALNFQGRFYDVNFVPPGTCSETCVSGYLYIPVQWDTAPDPASEFISSQIWASYSATANTSSLTFAIIGFTNELGAGGLKVWNDDADSFVYFGDSLLTYDAWNKFTMCHVANATSFLGSTRYYVNDQLLTTLTNADYAPVLEQVFLQGENTNLTEISFYWTNLDYNLTAVSNCTTDTVLYDCLDNAAVTTVLDTCQTSCGTDCTYCGQVYSYCTDLSLVVANYTLDACATITLDYILTSAGPCPFLTTLDGCCASIIPPVTPLLTDDDNKVYVQY